MARYFTISAGLRGCYMPDTCYEVMVKTRREPSVDYRNWWNLGAVVVFDGPAGDRLRGKIVRVSSNPDHIHVEVRGERYEVQFSRDNVHQVGGW